MAKVFSRRTLEKFEAASASIPLRQLDRAFQAAQIRLGKDTGGPDGARRAQFRRYLASVDQHDPRQLNRLGDALGALIAEVAESKVEFLVKAADSDGFFFADGVFRPARTDPSSSAFILDHVQLAMPVGGEDLARAFYGAALGLEEIPKPEPLAKRGGAWFRSGSVNIHLGVDSAFVPAKKAHPALRCVDYDGLIARLAARGINVVPDPFPFAGKPHCYVEDPFGNRIELIAG